MPNLYGNPFVVFSRKSNKELERRIHQLNIRCADLAGENAALRAKLAILEAKEKPKIRMATYKGEPEATKGWEG